MLYAYPVRAHSSSATNGVKGAISSSMFAWPRPTPPRSTFAARAASCSAFFNSISAATAVLKAERLQPVGHFLDRLVHLAPQVARGFRIVSAGRRTLADQLPIRRAASAPRPGCPGCPRAALVPAEGEHQVGADRVGPILRDQFIRRDDVALRLGHLLDFQVMFDLVDRRVSCRSRECRTSSGRRCPPRPTALRRVRTSRVVSVRFITSPTTCVPLLAYPSRRSDDAHAGRVELSAVEHPLARRCCRPSRGSPRIMPWLNRRSIGSSNRCAVSRPICFGDGFRFVKHAAVAHGLGEKPRVHQVHGRVLDAARILVDRQPVRALFRVERAAVVVRAQVAILVPRRAHEGVHRVGFARGRAAAVRARRVAGSLRDNCSGLSPVGMKSTSSGSRTGRSSSGTGTTPHSAQ